MCANRPHHYIGRPQHHQVCYRVQMRAKILHYPTQGFVRAAVEKIFGHVNVEMFGHNHRMSPNPSSPRRLIRSGVGNGAVWSIHILLGDTNICIDVFLRLCRKSIKAQGKYGLHLLQALGVVECSIQVVDSSMNQKGRGICQIADHKREYVGLIDPCGCRFAFNDIPIVNQCALMNDGETIFPARDQQSFVAVLKCRTMVLIWIRKITYDIQKS